jgi:hypothetical protein
MGALRTIEYTCDGDTIESFVANYSDFGLPKKGQTFSLQRVVNGQIMSPRYLIEAVFITDKKVQCDCSFIGYIE